MLTLNLPVEVETYYPTKNRRLMTINVKGFRKRYKETLIEAVQLDPTKQEHKKRLEQMFEEFQCKNKDYLIEHLLSQIVIFDIYTDLGIESTPIDLKRYPQFDPKKKEKVEFT